MKIVLGSAQFGMDYGINNKRGKIPKKEVFKILEESIESGIEIIDTASVYGESEKVIGEYLKENEADLKIITKISYQENKGFRAVLDESFKRLNVDSIYGCLLHNFNDLINHSELYILLKEYKILDKIKKIGISLYEPKEIDYIINNEIFFDMVQLPYNIFDQRFADYFEKLKEHDIEIHIRSVFLQGLIFRNPYELKGKFVKIKQKLIKLNDLSTKINIPLSAICLNFVILNKYVDNVVIGIDNLNHLRENINALIYDDEIKKYYNQLGLLREDNLSIILPTNWNEGE